MYEARNKSPADTEVIDVLIAISQVSARLARKLTILAAQRQSEEGGKHREQNERCHDGDHEFSVCADGVDILFLEIDVHAEGL